MKLSKYINKKSDLVLCTGASFNKDAHKYYYKSKELSGITGVIGKKLGLNYDNSFIHPACIYGTLVHDGVERFINTGKLLNNKDVIYTIKALEKLYFLKETNTCLCSEVLVTDYNRYASCIDIFVVKSFKEKIVDIYDIKTGKIKLDYLALQLGMYKYLTEKAGWTVNSCGVIATKDKFTLPLEVADEKTIKKVFYTK